jgi:hypothetical protein
VRVRRDGVGGRRGGLRRARVVGRITRGRGCVASGTMQDDEIDEEALLYGDCGASASSRSRRVRRRARAEG